MKVHPIYNHDRVLGELDGSTMVALIPAIADGAKVVFMSAIVGPDSWLDLCRKNPNEAAIAVCRRAYAEARREHLLPATP